MQRNVQGTLLEKDSELDDKAIRSLLRPGASVNEIKVEDEKGLLSVVIGEASFRKKLEGMELIEEFVSSDGKTVQKGLPLTLGQLAIITGNVPTPLDVRNVEAMEALIDSAYLAEDIIVDGEIIGKSDRLLTGDVVDLLKIANVPSVKIWKTIERIHVPDALQERLIDKIWGKPLSQAIDRDGNAVQDIAHMVDGRVVRSIMDGEITAIEIDDGIITRDKLVSEFL